MDLSLEKEIVDAGEIIETQKSKKIKMIAIAVGITIFAIGALLGISLTGKSSQTADQDLVLPTLIPLPTKEKRPSKFATNSTLLKIESETKNLENSLSETDFQEPKLNPPLIDLEIGF